MRLGWVLGWGIPEAWFAPMAWAAFPSAEHVFFAASANTPARLAAAGRFDRVVGYSLGTQLLLSAPAQLAAARVSLVAPIFAFPREEGLGGRISRTQVLHLARWLRRDPGAALVDFYARAALDVPPSLAPVETVADLEWGLDQLARWRVEPPLPSGWSAWCGADDSLLDPERLQALDARIVIVPGATHHPAALLRALAEETT